jgi:hypothetical protein
MILFQNKKRTESLSLIDGVYSMVRRSRFYQFGDQTVKTNRISTSISIPVLRIDTNDWVFDSVLLATGSIQFVPREIVRSHDAKFE